MKFKISFFVATFAYSGCLRPFSGTWGTLFALPFAYGVLWFGGPLLLVLSTIILCVIGFFAIEQLNLQNSEDPSYVVIDEVAGIFLTFCFLPDGVLTPYVAVGAFILFRTFDGWKPFFIGTIERYFSGSLGIMLDDIAAGLVSGLLLYLFLGL